ncbi:MAG: acylphosphatase [Anaerolineae bacterium]
MNTSSQRSKRKAVHITVCGRVQGVGFRYFTRHNAERHGVVGWVRNNNDGTVEIWAEGTEKRLNAFVKDVRRGPTHAWVRDVDLSWESPKGETRSFRVRY